MHAAALQCQFSFFHYFFTGKWVSGFCWCQESGSLEELGKNGWRL
jgi:hypothetical protein